MARRHKDVLEQERNGPAPPVLADENKGSFGGGCIGRPDVHVDSLKGAILGCIEGMCPPMECRPAEDLQPYLNWKGG